MNIAKNNSAIATTYGCENFGRLTKVLLHRPNNSLKLINQHNMGQWLFDQVPDIARFTEEHDRYREMLTSNGVEVYELSDYVVRTRPNIDYMPNLVYLHDIASITRKGAILSKMAWDARRGEEVVVREALTRLGIPIFAEFEEWDDAFEGCLLLSSETVLVAHTERHKRKSIDSFISRALGHFKEVIFVEIPKARRYMHPDTIYNRVDHNLALAYLPAFEEAWLHTSSGVSEIDFTVHMRRKGIEIINVTDSEQRRLACSFVPLQPGVILHYDTALDKETQLRLARKGVEIITFHPEAMVAGGGSLRCVTLRLHREANL